MRILHVGKYALSDPGGMERFVKTLAKGSVERGHQVKYMHSDTSWRSKSEHSFGLETESVPSFGKIGSLSLNWWSKKSILAWNPDVIHFHIPNPLAFRQLKSLNKPRIITYHADIVGKKIIESLYEKDFLKGLKPQDSVVFTSKTMRDAHALKLKDYSLEVVPIGVEPLVSPITKKNFKQYDLVFVGRLVDYKGLIELVGMMREIKGNLAIIGKGPLREQLEEEIRLHRVSDRVELLGYKEDEEVVELLESSKVFIFPSKNKSEAFGISLVEAMQCGKPLVTYNIPTGVSEVNVHNVTGLIAPLGDETRFIKNVNLLLDQPDLRASLGRSAKARAETYYLSDTMVEKYLKLYKTKV